MNLLSPAKINLFLRITSKRPDGFHGLASLFQAVSLFDEISFNISDTDIFTCTDSSLPTDSSNLIIKAVDLYREKTGIKETFNIHLNKKIPAQAGLGGGSSNAATTLWAANELCGRAASIQDLMSWAGEIGSDVAFFLSEGTAYCTGRGEKITMLPPLQKKDIWIIWPKMGCSTPAVYGKFNIDSSAKNDPQALLEGFLQGKPEYINDLERPAFSLIPELRSLKEKLLKHGFKTVMLSGSGSCFFCIGNTVPPEDLCSFKVSFINRQPNQWYK
jgi:4-diphosphocytidyl-2-C-methyl-D-erythritol kinase